MSIHRISKSLAKYLCLRNGTPDIENTMTYGIELIISEAGKGLVLLTVAYLMDLLVPVGWILLTAVSLRVATGGQHCSSHLRCTVMTLLTFLSLSYFAKIFVGFIHLNIWSLSCVFISSVLFILILETTGPGYSVNNPNPTTEMVNKVKKQSYLLITFWLLFAMLVFFFVKSSKVALVMVSVATGMLWQGFCLTGAGHQFIRGVDRFMILLKLK